MCGRSMLLRPLNLKRAKADHIEISSPASTIRLKVYLPVEEIVNVKNGYIVTIAENTGAEITEEPLGPGIPQNIYVCEVKPAYFVTNRYEYTGIPKMKMTASPARGMLSFPIVITLNC